MSYPGPDGAYHCFDLRGEPTEIEVPELGALVMAQAWGDSMLALVTRSDGEDPDDTATMLNWFDLETGDWSSFELESPLAAVQQLLWTQDAQSLFAVGYWVPEGQSVIHNPLFRIDAPADGFFAEDSPTIVPLGLGDFESVVGLSWLSDGSILTRSRVTFPDVNVRYGVVRWSPGAETGDYEILGEDSFDSARDFSVSPSGENLLIEGEVGDNVTGQFWMRDGQVLALPDVWPSGAVVWLPVATGFIMTRGSTLLWADLRNGVPDAWIDIEPE
jgi:hypothetical protein